MFSRAWMTASSIRNDGKRRAWRRSAMVAFGHRQASGVALGIVAVSLAVLFVQLQFDRPLYRAKAVVRFEDKGDLLPAKVVGTDPSALIQNSSPETATCVA